MATTNLSSLPSSPLLDSKNPSKSKLPTPEVSASVGHDHWTNDVINHVAHFPKLPQQEFSLRVKIQELKRKFHSGRALELKNLPDGVSESDIRSSFSDLKLTSIVIESTDGRYKASAKLYLEDPEKLDDWPTHRQRSFVKNKEVSVCVGETSGWLCLAKLPPSVSEEVFQTLVASYGQISEAFLMISERTGSSKSYGLIKYKTPEISSEAIKSLHGMQYESYKLDCDWLNSTLISFSSLHSKCLYVDHLPSNYRDMGEFRKVFSIIKNPPYCQIAMRNGVIQNWGLVEFFDANEAELTRDSRNGTSIHGSGESGLRVHYAIPGVNAINIYMQVVTSPETINDQGLLTETPSPNVYYQIKKLYKQNPTFAQNLQNIISYQIHGGTGSVSRASASSENLFLSKPGSSLNSNAQTALLILLTAQMRSQNGYLESSSLLNDPQVLSLLQSLILESGTYPLEKHNSQYHSNLLKENSTWRGNSNPTAIGGGALSPYVLPRPPSSSLLFPNPSLSSFSGILPEAPSMYSIFSSPINYKRKLPIPPSPENSPEGPYIGQHSQGLGGHYAESYWRNKKKSRFN